MENERTEGEMADEVAPMKGTIVSLQLCPGYRKPMRKVATAAAVENLGLRDDTHAIADSIRQILLIEKETLDMLRLEPGIVKENITTSGIALMKLKHHDRIKIGGEVVLEVSKPCSPCSRMEEIRPGLRLELAGRRGILARVLRGGTITTGDPIEQIAA